MKLRFSFALKIFLPYLVLGGIFLCLLFLADGRENPVLVYISIAGLVLSVVLGLIHLRWLQRSLERIRKLVGYLNRGEIPEFAPTRVGDELGDLERALGVYLEYLVSLRVFMGALASGDFTGKLESRGPDDEVGEALLSLRESLMISMREGEKRRLEEEHRSWNAEGLAKFAKLFREAEDDLKGLSNMVMKELVAYTEADVGALFIGREQEDGSDILELMGSYAFDREKEMEGSFLIGEGLVGRAAREKSPIYITELPSNYMKIRSGLGEDVPSSLLLVPVMLDDRVLGVMELASLGQIPDFQLEFVRQLGDALAATISKVKANLQNQALFDQTRAQADALASQEKVFRDKLEKLENIQSKTK